MSPPYRRNETGHESWTDFRQSKGSSNESRGRRRHGEVVELPESTQPSIQDPVLYRPGPFSVSTGYPESTQQPYIPYPVPYRPDPFSVSTRHPSRYAGERYSYVVPSATCPACDFDAERYLTSDLLTFLSACGYYHIRNERPASHADPCKLLSFEDNFASTIDDAVRSDWRYRPQYRTNLVSTQDSSSTCCVCEKINECPAIVPLQRLYMYQVCKRCKLLLDGIKQLKNAYGTVSGIRELFTRATHLRFHTRSRVGVPLEFSVQGSWPELRNPQIQYITTLDSVLTRRLRRVVNSLSSYKSFQDVFQKLNVDRVVSLLRKWTSSCDRFHPQCKSRADARLPKRVISIPLEDTGTIKLLEEPVDINARYIALSYCWGPSGTRFRTTLETLPTYLEEIPVSHFPRLFLDVISICKALGIRYLWIDALCIIQDSVEDWELQSAQMASIYSNSYLTIAATACADPSATLFSERWTEYVLNKERIRIGVGSIPIRSEEGTVRMRPSLHLAHDRFTKIDNAQDHMIDAPLLTRAWTYQERLLPAHTLHFHAEELVWECKSGVRCECGHLDHQELQSAEPYSQEISYKPQPDRWLKSFIAQAEQADKSLEDLCNIWMDLISEYSGLSLTYEGDRLPALSGLAVNFSNKSLGEYVAGMWTKALPALLLWEVCSHAERPFRQCDVSSPSAPSWSWASVRLSSGVAVTYTRVINVAAGVLDDLEILNVHADVIGKNPYGWVRNAVLEVRGRTVECAAIETAGGEIVLKRDDPEIAAEEESGTEHAIMELIMDYQGVCQPGMKVMALSIGSRFGIALEKIVTDAAESPVYRRVGLVVWKEGVKTWPLLQNNRENLTMRRLSII